MYDLADIAWDRTLFFFKYEGLNVVCRILEGGTDYVGRTIYSLEGLVSVNQGMRSRLSIADIVDYFTKNPVSFFELESEEKLCSTLELDEVINPLLPFNFMEGIGTGLQVNGFRELMSDIAERKGDYGFVIAPEADIVFPYVASFVFTGQKLCKCSYVLSADETESAMDATSIEFGRRYLTVKRGMKLENNKTVKLFLKIWKEGKTGGGYQWHVVDNTAGTTVKGDKKTFKCGIPFSKLVEEQKKLKTYYMLLGYDVV